MTILVAGAAAAANPAVLEKSPIASPKLPSVYSSIAPIASIRRAIPAGAPPVIDAADNHVAGIEGERARGRCERRPRIIQHFDLVIGSDELFRRAAVRSNGRGCRCW